MPRTTATCEAPRAAGAAPAQDRRAAAWVFLGAALVACFLVSLALGSASIPVKDVVRILAGAEPANPSWSGVILQSRLPRTLTAMLAGCALAVSGLLMQTMFRNPLAGPYVLGVDAGASLGVALATLSLGVGRESLVSGLGSAGQLTLLAAAACGAAAAMLIVLAVSLRLRSNVTLLIVGLMIGYFASGVGGILFYLSEPESVQKYMQWTFGSFGATWSSVRVLALAAAVGVPTAALMIKPMDALLLGEDYARSVGVSVGATRFWMIYSASLLAAGATAVCGPIGFIGVAVPHLARGLWSTSRHLILVPAVAGTGAVVAILADVVARVPYSQSTLPLNAVTALFGAPLLIWLVLRRVEVGE
jgi:iron complex transport system permease protein